MCKTLSAISKNGRVDVWIKMQNKVALMGYCFNSAYVFRDRSGNVLYSRKTPQYCVDGTLVPFAGPSKRMVHVKFVLPEAVLRDVADVVIIHSPGHKDPLKLLANAIRKGWGIVRLFA